MAVRHKIMKNLFKDYYIEENNTYKTEEENVLITDNIYIIKNNERIRATSKDFKKLSKIFFIIDFSSTKLDIHVAKRLVRKIKRISKYIAKNTNKVGIQQDKKIIIGNIIGLDKQYANDILTSLVITLIKDKKEKYNYLYDNICWYLDNEFAKNNYCGFKNNKCIAIKPESTNCYCCCWHFKNKRFGALYQSAKTMVPCEYFDDNKKTCSTKCIRCKLVSCPAVKKKGGKFTIWNVLLIKYYFNIVQKTIVLCTPYTKKEIILKWINRTAIK